MQSHTCKHRYEEIISYKQMFLDTRSFFFATRVVSNIQGRFWHMYLKPHGVVIA